MVVAVENLNKHLQLLLLQLGRPEEAAKIKLPSGKVISGKVFIDHGSHLPTDRSHSGSAGLPMVPEESEEVCERTRWEVPRDFGEQIFGSCCFLVPWLNAAYMAEEVVSHVCYPGFGGKPTYLRQTFPLCAVESAESLLRFVVDMLKVAISSPTMVDFLLSVILCRLQANNVLEHHNPLQWVPRFASTSDIRMPLFTGD